MSNGEGEKEEQVCSTGLKHWIKLHQEVLSVTEDIIDLYSPMLCVYFLYIYSTVAFTIYSALQNTHSHTLVEVMVLVYFTLMTLTNFYILCHYGNKIKEQSENTIRAVFAAPWYDCSHFQKTFLKIVILRSQKAIIVTSFSSTVFDLTNSTFIVIMKSIVSFYLGLVKMRQQAEISSEM
ncbi:odorant receptor coreceptor-like [Nilaparvata lugens]|uniref:odorant receptor coreceptor-like n=1 Tax=Nilaparvata lugens TaxID=108931 RepID=UPI00193CD3A0|nr:odorant receptor coreceptor-like [Nilaparvata lugens]